MRLQPVWFRNQKPEKKREKEKKNRERKKKSAGTVSMVIEKEWRKQLPLHKFPLDDKLSRLILRDICR